MEITVNGEKQRHGAPLTIGGLLEFLGVDPRSVVVERNMRIVPRNEMENEPVGEGDAVEIIRFVGGG
jgi:thiamine biosynthesis protein ThiS